LTGIESNGPNENGCHFWFSLFAVAKACTHYRCRSQRLFGRTTLSRRSSRNVVLWDFCDTWRIFLPDYIAGRFSCSNVTIRPRRGRSASNLVLQRRL
jgi:hypothetical protein